MRASILQQALIIVCRGRTFVLERRLKNGDEHA
jgi:hypothetical protein